MDDRQQLNNEKLRAADKMLHTLRQVHGDWLKEKASLRPPLVLAVNEAINVAVKAQIKGY
jgi:hypothetical protein